jgi:hypothetical protein
VEAWSDLSELPEDVFRTQQTDGGHEPDHDRGCPVGRVPQANLMREVGDLVVLRRIRMI